MVQEIKGNYEKAEAAYFISVKLAAIHQAEIALGVLNEAEKAAVKIDGLWQQPGLLCS